MKKLSLMLCLAVSSLYGMEEQKVPFGEDILMVINSHHALGHIGPSHVQSNPAPFLQTLYSRVFPHSVNFGPDALQADMPEDTKKGWYAYCVLAAAMKQNPGYKGYLLVHDDVVLNPENLARFDKNKMWINRYDSADLNQGEEAVKNWNWWPMAVGYAAIKTVFEKLAPIHCDILQQNCGENGVAKGFADVVYMPAEYNENVQVLSEQLAGEKVFGEIAMPTMCACLEKKENCEHFNARVLWGEDAKNPLEKYSSEIDYLHPVNMASQDTRDFLKENFTQGGE